MANLNEASATRERFLRDAQPPAALDLRPTSVYEVDISPRWCIGNAAHGGVLVDILVDAVLRRQANASSPHRDPAHLSAQFLTATIPGKATVDVRVVSESKRWTRLEVELYQWTPNVNTTDYLDPKAQRTLRIQAHFLVTTLPDHPPIKSAGTSSYSTEDSINHLSRPCPLLVHPSQIDMSQGGEHIPEKMKFRDAFRWKDVEVVQSDGALASGNWIQMTGGEDITLSAALVGFFADIAKNGPSMLPADQRPAVAWYPTMSFALDFKSKFPLNSSPASTPPGGFARRTFGIYSTTKSIHEGRHDLTVEVWAVDGELGEGPPRAEEKDADGVAKWRREGARCVGISTQMALSLSIAINHSRVKTPTLPGESDADSSGSSGSEAEGGERRKARL